MSQLTKWQQHAQLLKKLNENSIPNLSYDGYVQIGKKLYPVEKTTKCYFCNNVDILGKRQFATCKDCRLLTNKSIRVLSRI